MYVIWNILNVQVFQTGFRSSRKFQKKLFIWDLLERVQEQLVASETAQPTAVEVGVVRSVSSTERGSSTSPDPEMHCQQMFLNAVSRINSNNPNVGKDEKAMRFFCLGLRYIVQVMTLYETPHQSLSEHRSATFGLSTKFDGHILTCCVLMLST